jgi:hypothetical protein
MTVRHMVHLFIGGFVVSRLVDGSTQRLTFAGKSKVINKAIQDIGMGRYQWQLFVLCGFGWLADKSVSAFRRRIVSLS